MSVRTVCATTLGAGEGVLLSRQSEDGSAVGYSFNNDANRLRRFHRLFSGDAIRGYLGGQCPCAESGGSTPRRSVARKDRKSRQLRQHRTASEGPSRCLRAVME